MQSTSLAILFIAAVLAIPGAFAENPIHEAEIIFEPLQLHSHSSSIVETPEGNLLACWFQGGGERKNDDVRVMGARKQKGATVWSDPYLMADSHNLPDCNPILFIDPQGTLWLMWVAIQDNEWHHALLKYRQSTDYEGEGAPNWAWQDVVHCRPKDLETLFPPFMDEIAEQFKEILAAVPKYQEGLKEMRALAADKLDRRLGWMTRTHPIVLPDGRMMVGLYSDGFNCALAAFTDDSGKSWSFSEPILGSVGNIQPSFVRKDSGTISVFMRDNGLPKRIQYAESENGGISWSRAVSLEIPNPGSSVECIRLRNGNWLLICNDTTQGRHRLMLYLSEDEGRTWPTQRALEDLGEGNGRADYPSITQAKDGSIHVTHTYSVSVDYGDKKTIKHHRFNEAWVLAGN
jgi:predicted neuraminidase